MLLSTLAALTVNYLSGQANAQKTNYALADRVEFQTFELDGQITDMMWCGRDDETVLLQTGDGSIYRSRDRGSNWKRLKALMQKQGLQVADQNQDVSCDVEC
jgi:photosystem II stability/assembly factor-like uncharacterized protein